MPPEPDNKMDNLLKTYAKKRREEAGAPMEMHSVTRRLLQAEAAKLKPSGSPASTSWLDTIKSFWPRFAFAAGILFVAGIMAVTFLLPTNQNDKMFHLAKQDAKESGVYRYGVDEQVRDVPSAQPASPGRPELDAVAVLRDQSPSKELLGRELQNTPKLTTTTATALAEYDIKRKAVDVAQNEPRNNLALSREPIRTVTVPPTSVAPFSVAPAESRTVQLGAVGAVADVPSDKRALAAGGPPVAAPAIPALAPVQLGRTDSLAADAFEAKAVTEKNENTPVVQLAFKDAAAPARREVELQQQLDNGTVRSRFAGVQPASRQTLGKATAAQNSAVLANFVVEQSGEELRLVDGDGSVYSGKVFFGEPAAIVDQEANSVLAAGTRMKVSKPALSATGAVGDDQTQQEQNVQGTGSSAASAWNFRVSGTNRTLQQPVIVDGVVFETAASNALNQTQAGAKNNADGYLQFYRLAPGQIPAQQRNYGLPASTVQNSVTPLPGQTTYGGQSMNLLNARRIQGQVRVGATNQLPLDAVPDGNQP